MENFMSLIGFLLPPLIDLANNTISNSYARFWVSVVICSLVGVLIEFLTTGLPLTLEGSSTQILLTFGMAQLTYQGLWKGSEADKQLKNIQQ